MSNPKVRISKSELRKRQKSVLKQADEKDFDAVCLFDPKHVFYLTYFGFIQTERPIALILTMNREIHALIPALERDRIEEIGCIDHKKVYPEYPGEKHPMRYLKELFEELGLKGKTIGVDAKSAPGGMGYKGPDLGDILPNCVFKNQMDDILQEMMVVKSEEEISLIEESAKWANLAHRNLQEYIKPGLRPTSVAQKATLDASKAMMKALGKKYRAYRSMNDYGAQVGFRGQIGQHAALPHSVAINATIRGGDVLITGAGPGVGGYKCELERTMIVGQPTEKQRKYFNLMKKAQEVAFETIEAGVECSKVDKAVRKFYRGEGIKDYWRHHVGHGLGLGVHEPPFFDIGDDTILKPGMVMSVEPGIYIPGFAGFRHSDTIVVTEDGMERITYYPRDIDELTVPI